MKNNHLPTFDFICDKDYEFSIYQSFLPDYPTIEEEEIIYWEVKHR